MQRACWLTCCCRGGCERSSPGCEERLLPARNLHGTADSWAQLCKTALRTPAEPRAAGSVEGMAARVNALDDSQAASREAAHSPEAGSAEVLGLAHQHLGLIPEHCILRKQLLLRELRLQLLQKSKRSLRTPHRMLLQCACNHAAAAGAQKHWCPQNKVALEGEQHSHAWTLRYSKRNYARLRA